MGNENSKLSEVYSQSIKFGKIKLTPEGLDFEGKLITNLVKDSIKLRRFGKKTVVSCDFLCDEFQSIPK
jgi:hypothetical protein